MGSEDDDGSLRNSMWTPFGERSSKGIPEIDRRKTLQDSEYYSSAIAGYIDISDINKRTMGSLRALRVVTVAHLADEDDTWWWENE